MTEPRWKVGLLLVAVMALAANAFAAISQDGGPARAEQAFIDPAIALIGLRLAPPDPLTSSPRAGLDAARAELAAGLALSEHLARGREARVALMRPSAGPILESFGARQAGGLRAQGLTFKIAAGAEILSPSAGDVLYAGPLRGLGQAVIIQATPRTQVVLAGDFAVQVQEGESLREGQRLALAANRGVRVNLYLELRDLGRPIDPAPWLRPEKAASQGSGFRRETG